MVQDSGHFDLVIVGGGIAGAALALELSRSETGAQMKIAVLESTPDALEARGGPERVIALSWGSKAHLDRLGVWDETARLGAAPIRDIHVCEPGNEGTVDLTYADALAEGRSVEALGYVIQLAHAAEAIRNKLASDAPNVKWLCPARLVSMQKSAERVDLQVAVEGKTRSMTASLLVGADGTHSQVRHMAGITTLGWDYNRFGLVASIRPEIAHKDVAYECFRETGPLAFLPLDAERCSIVWSLKPDEAARLMLLPDAAFLKALQKAGGREIAEALGSIVETGPRACFPLELRQAKSCGVDRIALIGNAAHTIHPVGGQGLNLGLRDVAVLADVLLNAREAGRDPGTYIVLDEYRERRYADHAAVISFTEGLNAAFASDFAPLRWLRSQGLNTMQRMSFMRDLLMHQAAGIAQMPGLRRAA